MKQNNKPTVSYITVWFYIGYLHCCTGQLYLNIGYLHRKQKKKETLNIRKPDLFFFSFL